MKQELFLALLVSLIWVSSLQAMEIEENHQQKREPKASTVENRRLRDAHFKAGEFEKARLFSVLVINETPMSHDNEDAIPDDFRLARDLHSIYTCDKSYLSDATSYVEGISLQDSTNDYLRIAINLYRLDGNAKLAQSYVEELNKRTHPNQ